MDAAREEGRIGGRRPKLTPQQQAEIRKMVSKGDKSAADAARLFKIHPAHRDPGPDVDENAIQQRRGDLARAPSRDHAVARSRRRPIGQSER